MPQTPERKRQYMRELQRKRRGLDTAREDFDAKTGHLSDEQLKAEINGLRHEHYWLRDGSQVACVPFNFRGRDIGGCGEIRDYRGQLFDVLDDGELSRELAGLPSKIIDQWLRLPNGPINTGKHPQRDAP